jgi:uncharacterized protein
MEKFTVTEKNKIRRAPHRGVYDQQAVYEILDAGFVCCVAFVDNNEPVIIPMSYGRKDNALYLHGASGSRIITLLASGPPVCINVTFIDGIVVARSMFDASVNYRSVVLFGNAVLIGDEEKLTALHCISEHIIPGRWAEVREPLPNELKATSILKVEIINASAKIRTGPPKDSAADLEGPVWAGVVPLVLRADEPIADPLLNRERPVPASVYSMLTKYA